jgi:hypothetical protein
MLRASDQALIAQFVDLSLQELQIPAYDLFYTEQEQLTDARFLDDSRVIKGNQVPWKAIKSLITDAEIYATEQALQVTFPPSYRHYLQYKNFYELGLLSEVEMLCPLIPGQWSQKLLQEAFDGYPQKYIYDRGLVPFATYSDWGLTCFNTQKASGGEYEIVVWDHERVEEQTILAPNLVTLFAQIIRQSQHSEQD